MSIKIMNEVWEHAPVSQGALLVLLALADSADERSRECWPSVRHLAERARLKERQVQNVLRELAEDGIVHVTMNAGRSGSNLYRITPASKWGGAKIAGGAIQCTGGVQSSAPGGVQSSAPEPSYRTVNEPSLFPSSADDVLPQPKSNDLDKHFEAFWSAYPKRVEKKGARAKFAAAVKSGVDPARIVAAAETYARSENVRRGFAKHPTTWLNAGCWEDELPGAPRPAGAPDPRQAQVDSLLQEAETLERVGFPGMAESKRGEARRLREAMR